MGNKEVNVALSALSGVGPVRSGKLAGAGLDGVEREPLPVGDELLGRLRTVRPDFFG